MKEDVLQPIKVFFENPMMKSMMAAFGANMESFTNVLGFYATRNPICCRAPGEFVLHHPGQLFFLLTFVIYRKKDILV
jgi:hypothetical protein